MRGLLVIEPLYHQIVAGNKIQTRRSGGLEDVNDCSIEMNGHVRNPDDWHKGKMHRIDTDAGEVLLNQMFRSARNSDLTLICKPRYKIGEVLYLKEPYRTVDPPVYIQYAFDYMGDVDIRMNNKWSNKLFMPEAFARQFIKITGIRCERLMDISDQDCIAEGIETCASIPIQGERYVGYKNYLRSKNGGRDMLHTCEWYIDMFPHRPDLSAKRSSFLSLYKFANKVKEVPNLWVWVYEFEYIKNYQA